ncbi:MAG: helix-turn-helix domain-containing protein [Polyangiaceae bacterium]|nr:helix-turn-helix domain-containing protein [Polyangiaceae bacterium]
MSHDAIIAAAERGGATVIHAPGATIIVIPARAADGDDLLSIKEAATLAKCSVRTLRDEHRIGNLVMFGKQRSRTVRRADLLVWIESRRVTPKSDIDDLDIERRMKRLARAS